MTSNPNGPVLSDINDPSNFNISIDELNSRLNVSIQKFKSLNLEI